MNDAYELKRNVTEPLSDTRGCRWCSHALSCSILQYTSGSVVLDAFFKKQIEHLDQNHVEYFKKFARWILMEWRHVEGRNSVDKENFNARSAFLLLKLNLLCGYFRKYEL